MKHRTMIDRMQQEQKCICEYCGAEFVIGASKAPSWMLVEGTVKMCCPSCWQLARAEGIAAVNRHVGIA